VQIKNIILYILLLVSYNLHAQWYKIKSVGKNDGLPESEVYNVFEAKDKLLYLGTAEGLYRFDGAKIFAFPRSKNHNYVGSITQDKNNLIWYSTSEEICWIDNNGQVHPTLVLDIVKKIDFYAPNIVSDQFFTWQGELYFTFRNYILKCEPNKISIVKKYNFQIQGLLVNNGIHIIGDKKIHELDKQFNITKISYQFADDITMNNKMTCDSLFVASSKDKVLLCSAHGIVKELIGYEDLQQLTKYNGKLIGVCRNYIKEILPAQANNIFKETNKFGMTCFHHTSNDKLIVGRFADDVGIYESNKGIITAYQDSAKKISHHIYKLDANSFITQSKEDITQWDISTAKKSKLVKLTAEPLKRNKMVYDSMNKRYLNFTYESVQFYDKEFHYQRQKDYGITNPIKCALLYVLHYKQQKYIVQKLKEMFVYDAATNATTMLKLGIEDLDDYYSSIQLHKGFYWVTTIHKIWKLDSNLNVLEQIKIPSAFNKAKPIQIAELLFYNDTSIVVGTFYNGLYLYSLRTKQAKPLLAEHLMSQNIFNLLTDSKNNVYACGSTGLLMLYENLKQCRLLYTNTTLQGEIYQTSFKKINDTLLVFGWGDNVLAINPAKIEAKQEPELYFTNIQLDNKFNNFFTTQKQDLINGITIKQQYHDLNIFWGIKGMEQQDVYLQYKIDNGEWIKAINNNISLNNLHYGNTTLTLQLIDPYNNYQVIETVVIPIKHITPFWRTWWFISLCILALMFCTYLITKYITTLKIRNKTILAEESHKRLEEKKAISKELHDNIGSQITYINKVIENLNDPSQQHSEDEKLKKLELIQQQTTIAMGQLRESIWAVNTEQITLFDIVLRLNALGSKMSKEYGIEYSFDGAKPPTQSINPNVSLHIYRILQEAINNAFKHSEASKIILSYNNNTFTVHDDGVGITQKATESYGLINMQERAKEINAELEIKQANKGTVITLKLK
jgi:signal transduction histidine kinase